MATKNTNLSHFNKEDVPNAKGLSFGIVVSEWNENITEGLYKGAYDALIECGANASDISRLDVPGSYELVFGAKIAAKQNPDAIICLGSVIQGETKHFDFVCNAVSMGIKDLNISLDIPVIFGVLTDNTMEQAVNRSGGKYGNKGIEAAITAIKMAVLNK
ncbi:6,7-dimethyl-8-ribityllumazine synthase [Flavobacteriales bacterium]|jgi:6,7-dimethyl-8-ribityllumazine synthase|nr:6,7-dimethyl-8-ribityllumazine synthase [Flavobacteriales bacterium]MDC3394784.1 6,7-dimethyl-8-ribityllumazine synthase [Flavobacteriales bacterium]MDG1349430.1 6,7-dimethyl-8-ribityllumazine synthase [Flavobacteriales bacterium]